MTAQQERMLLHRTSGALMMTLLAASAAAMLVGLGRLPALTADESWMGLYASRLAANGLFSPHEMNAYTGPLYGLILVRILAIRSMSVASLRLFGAGANTLAILLVGLHLRRRVSGEAAFWWSVLLAGSAYLLLKSRLAWEVYALQPLLLALTLEILDGAVTWPRALLFCAVTLVGVLNHFIYLSVPLSLCVLYGARAAWRGEEEARAWLRLSLSTLAMGAVIFLVKLRLTESAWPAERTWAVPLFLSLAPTAAAAAVFAGEWEGRIVAMLAHPLLRGWGRRALGLGLAAFLIWHGAPLWLAFAGPVVWKRIFSWSAPWWMALPLDVWSSFLLGLLAWRAARAWHGREPMSPHERTLALWPAAYAAIFILFRNTSSLRYYSPIQFLCLVSLAAALPRLPRPDRKAVFALAAFAVAATQGVFWHEIAAPGDRRPLAFKIGWHTENSRDFARKDSLFSAYDASGACGVEHPERNFVSLPLGFHRQETGPLPCAPTKTFDADQCPDCATPPFYRWNIVAH